MPITFRVIAGVATVIGSVAITNPTLSAGSDCNHATSSREQVICQDPQLSELDGQVQRAYQKQRAALSVRGAELLRKSQHNWLDFISTVCPTMGPLATMSYYHPEDCFRGEYQARLRTLTQYGQRIGPFVFNRIDLYSVHRAASGDESGSRPGFHYQLVSYPQIDSPRTPQATAWNVLNKKHLAGNGDCEDEGDYDTSYSIGYASARLISVEWTNSYYCYGMAHSVWNVRMQNVVLQPTARDLTEQDLFGPEKAWVPKVQDLFWDALGRQGWKPPEGLEEQTKESVGEVVIRPDHWMVTPKGLRVSFGAYEVTCYACTPKPVTVPWTLLRPLLSPDAPVPP